MYFEEKISVLETIKKINKTNNETLLIHSNSEMHHKVTNPFKFIFSFLFLFFIFIKYPLILRTFYPSGHYATDFFISSLAQLSAFSTAMIFFYYKKFVRITKYSWIFIICLVSITILSIIHCVKIPNSTFREFFFDISWISIPLSVMLYRDYLKNLLLYFFSGLWIFNIVQSLYQIYSGKICIGITGNRNWNAALLISLTPIFLYSIFMLLKKILTLKQNKYPIILSKKIITIFVLFSSIIIFLTLFLLYKAESRGANLALMVSITSFAFLEGFFANSKKIKYFTKKIFLSFSFLMGTAIIIVPILFSSYIAAIISKDVRIPLWHGAFNLFCSKLFIGTGSFAFEKFYAYHLPLELFLRPHYFAARFMHPHNQIAYFAASFGFLGLIALLILYFMPIIFCIKNYKSLSIYTKIIFFSYLMILIHAQLDKIAIQWPTSYILLIFLGLLWNKTFTLKNEKCINNLNIDNNEIQILEKHKIINKYYIIYSVLTLICLSLSFKIIFENSYSSYYSRISNIFLDEKNYKNALKFKKLAIDKSNNPDYLYDAGMIELLAFKNYPNSYRFFKLLESHPASKIVHSNARIAQCLIFMNQKKEALKYLMLEASAYPLSSLTLYNQMLLEKELGLFENAKQTAKKLNSQLKFKGLKTTDMKLILKYPELDNKFNLIHKNNPK
jgi:tetratricopeptide (TPR) repeat protein